MRPFVSQLETAAWSSRLLLTLVMAFGSSLFGPTTYANPSIVPEDIAYTDKTKTPGTIGNDVNGNTHVVVGTAELPATAQAPVTDGPETQSTGDLNSDRCVNHSNIPIKLQKFLAITRFLRTSPHSANGGNLFAAETGVPALIRTHLSNQYQTINPGVLAFGFASPDLADSQLKQHAQKIARQARSQFVLSGTIDDMSMTTPEATYNPNLYRQAANVFHDVTTIKMFDKRTRVMNISVQLRDGFTGELLLNKQYSTTGIWNQRKPVGFDSPGFYRTDYGRNVKTLAKKISREVAEVIHCQPFMASIDSQPGQSHILLHGGANNGLHAGDSLSLYQVVVVGSNTEYQVNETRLVKRDARLHLSEVYPSHSIALVEGGSYLNGHYLAVSE